MFSGRFSQSPIILSIIRRATSCEHTTCSRCIAFPKQPISEYILAAQQPCNLRLYCSHDRDFGTKMAASFDTDVKPKHTNRLIDSKSPYLLQHAHNPVDWYPWGDEAFEKARKEDKLIFLSVGYSTCHWCHVMERESFENEDIAKVMNEHFVNIKVDREERPDVDKVYMTFVQACSGSGGWPMSVFLKPDLKPVSGGTYYPPEDRYGRRGFKSELLNWAKEWKENKAQWARVSDSVTEVIRNASVFEVPMLENLISGNVPGPECWELCTEQLAEHYEPVYGGFSLAPKFPQPCNLVFSFHVFARKSSENKKLLGMVLHTLNMMARGGIHDHVGQGFARYSTDIKWHVPHFEKMLYDQGQLAVVYSQAYLATKQPQYEATVRDILAYVARDLSHKDGGFYCAEDADSFPTNDSKEKKEGAFCVFTHEEVTRLLSRPVESKPEVKLADVFCHHYNVQPGGNVDPDQDPHNELTNQNVLMIVSTEEKTAAKFGLEVATVQAELSLAREVLYEERLKRPKPHLDNKILTSWNGLMVSGFAKSSEALQDENLVKRAISAAEFIKNHLYDKSNNVLLRSCYTDENGNAAQISPSISGFLDDYAFLIQGLLDLYEASLESRWLEWAEQLQIKQDELFWDVATAGYFSTPHSSNLILRLKEDQDGAEPSGNSVSCLNLLRLSALLDWPRYKDQAGRLLASFTSRLTSLPLALPLLTSALMLYHDSRTQIIITGNMSDPNTASLVSVVRSRLIPGRVLILADGDSKSILYRNREVMRRLKPPSNNQQNAYVCRNHSCALPVQTAHDLAVLLDSTCH